MKTFMNIPILLLFGSLHAQQGNVALASIVDGHREGEVLAFEENKGQIYSLPDRSPCSEVKYHLGLGELDVFLLQEGIAYQFERIHRLKKTSSGVAAGVGEAVLAGVVVSDDSVDRIETYRMDMRLIDANPNARITVEGRSADYVNYYNHNAFDVRRYSKITYHDVYPHIDWVIYGEGSGIKYDFVVRPGGDPAAIQLAYQHHEGMELNPDGSLRIWNRMGEVKEKAPVSFQESMEVETRFTLENDKLRFELGQYDPAKTIVIDPSLIWATYYGSSYDTRGSQNATDASGNVYLTGYTDGNTGIALGGHQNTFGGDIDAFLVKFNSAGSRIWATYYGGTGADYGGSVAIDASDNVYFSGNTASSTNIASGGHQIIFGGMVDVFVVKFNSAGTRIWGTYYGGAYSEAGGRMAVDPSQNLILVGYTGSNSNIASGGHQNVYGGGNEDGFIVKFNSAGLRQWSSYYGGANEDYCTIPVTDASGTIYISGITNSQSGIASGGFQNAIGGSQLDCFLLKMDAAGTRIWATYYGGAAVDAGGACTVGPSGDVYLYGQTFNSSGIASGGHQNTYGGGTGDAFLVKFNATGQRQWATYYGGAGGEISSTCVTDLTGNVYISGRSNSPTGIAFNGFQMAPAGYTDAFLAKFSASGVREWGTFFGGEDEELSTAVSVKGSVAYLSGTTQSVTGIGFNGYQNSLIGGYLNAYLAKILICSSTSSTLNATSCGAYTLNGQTYSASGTYTQTLLNASGCDSTITLQLTVNNASASTMAQSACNSYTLNGQTYTSSGTYIQTLPNAAGCDSTITLQLTVNNASASSLTQFACNSYTLNGQTYTSSGTYTQTLSNAVGCDSTITLNLTIGEPSFGILSQTACGSYSLNGQTYASSGTYTQTLVNISGCDSTLTLTLTIQNLTASISVNGETLIASPSGQSYQWIQCPSGQPIAGATGATFTPSTSGSYAVVINAGVCVDTSACETVVGLGDDAVAMDIVLYPNPSSGAAYLHLLGSDDAPCDLRVFDLTGRLMIQCQGVNLSSPFEIDLQNVPTGIYMIEVSREGQKSIARLVVE